MTIHFVFLLLMFSLVYVYRKYKEKIGFSKSRKIFFLLIAALLVLFIGLRKATIGTDTLNYVVMFETGQWHIDNIEVAFPFVGDFVKLFTDRYCVFLIIISTISLIGVLDVLKNKDFEVEIFIYLYITSYCYLYSATAIRFFCAFSILLIAFKYMVKKKTLKVILLILLAMLFHTSAIIFIPIYFVTRFKYSRKNIMLFFATLAILTILLEVFSEYVFDINIFQKYAYVGQTASINFGPSIFINLATLLLALCFYEKIEKYKDEYELCIKILIVGFFVDMLSISYRAVWYFRFPIWFIVPIILVNMRQKNRKIYMVIYVLTIIFYGVYYFYVLANSLPSHNFLDYSFNWELK